MNPIKSLQQQSYNKINHVISNDNHDEKYDRFLQNEKNVVNVKKVLKEDGKHCPYNDYLNKLVENSLHGWCMILDDDAKFINKNFVKHVANVCSKSSTKDIIVYDIYIGSQKKILPIDMNDQIKNGIRIGRVDMGCIAFHSSCDVKFRTQCAGDYFFLADARERGYNIKYVKLPIGIWANYKGWSHGKFVSCDVVIQI